MKHLKYPRLVWLAQEVQNHLTAKSWTQEVPPMTQYHSLVLQRSINKAMLNYPHWPFGLAMIHQKFNPVWMALQKEVQP